MTAKILLIRHNDDPEDDRVATHFRETGRPVTTCRPFRGDLAALSTDPAEVAGTVIFGGKYGLDRYADHPFLADEARWIETCLANDIPLLGICQGAQQIAHVLGAKVGPRTDHRTEFGYYPVTATPEGRDIFPDQLTVLQNHFHGHTLTTGMTRLATSPNFPNQAFQYGTAFGFQFHAEVTIPGLRRWQAAPWALYGQPGAQDRATQDRLAAQADAPMDRWFRATLTHIFGP